MKNLRKSLTIVLSAVILINMITIFSISTKAAERGESGYSDGYEYEFLDEETIEIRRCWNQNNTSEINVPSSINGYTVVSIGSFAYGMNENATSIVFPDTVTQIKEMAFADCNKLTTIAIPKNISVIEEGAFENCSAITQITVDAENTTFDSRDNCNAIIETESKKLILGCNNTTIPNTITEIGESAFSGCNMIESIELPDTLKKIGNSAFRSCSGLTEIQFSNNLTEIGSYAFSDCTELSGLTLPNGLEKIGEYAFNRCTHITAVNIPSSVTFLGSAAFNGCSNLSNIVVPETLTRLEKFPFYGTAWHKAQPDGCIYINKNLCSYKGTCPEEITIAPDTISINCSALSSCSNLKRIVIPDSVIEIQDEAFWNCENLNSIYISGSVQKIGQNIIYKNNLTNIEVAEDNEFFDSRNGCNCIINSETDELIIGCKNSVIPDTIKSIGRTAFHYVNSISDIIIPNSVVSIGDFAFSNSSITSVTIPGSVKTIGACAFLEARSLKTVTMSKSVSEIKINAFSCCSIENVYYTGSEDDWNEIIFGDNNNQLTNATVHYNYEDSTGVLDIDGSAFSGAGDSTSTHLHDNVRLTDYPDVNMNGHSDFVIYREEWRNNRIELALYNTTTAQPLVYQSGWTLGFSDTSLYRDDEKYYLDTENNRWVKFENGYSYASNHCTGVFVSSRDVVSSGSGTLVLKGLWSNGIPANAVEHNGHYYVFYDESVSWSQAKAKCEELGGHLVTVNSAEEQTFLVNLTNKSTKKNMWIGAYPENGAFRWITNEEFSYTNWAPGEPNNVFNMQNAAMMYTKNASYTAGTWNDENENGRDWSGYELSNFGYICEWDAKPLTLHHTINDTYSLDHNDVCSSKIQFSHYAKIFGYIPTWINALDKKDNGEGGMCFGMAITSAASSVYNLPSPSSYRNADCLYNIKSKNWNSTETGVSVLDYIKCGHVYQYTPEYQKIRSNNKNMLAQDLTVLYNAVMDYLNNGGDSVQIGIRGEIIDENGQSEDAGHQLRALGLGANDSNHTEIIVYDCNHPGEYCVLNLNKNEGQYNSWDYQMWDGLIWGTGRRYASISYDTSALDFAFLYNLLNPNINRNYKYLLTMNNSDTILSEKDGYKGKINECTDIDTVLPIVLSDLNSSANDNQLYWVNFDNELSFSSVNESSNYCIASENTLINVEAPPESSIDISIGEENNSAVRLELPQSKNFQVEYGTSDENNNLHSTQVFGCGTNTTHTEQTINGVIVNGAESISVIHDDNVCEDTVYQLNGEKNSLIQNNDGVPVVLEDSNNDGSYDREVEPKLIGDTNLDGKVDIRDITAIQRHLAELETMTDEQVLVADTNLDSELDISDATWGQMYLAEYFESFLKPYSESEPEEDNEDKYVYFKNSDSWSDVKAHMWSDESEKDLVGTEMEQIEDDVYRVVVPDDAMWIQFSGNNGTAQTEEMQIIDYGLIFEDDSWKEYLYSSNN